MDAERSKTHFMARTGTLPHLTRWPTQIFSDLCTEYCNVCLTVCSSPRMAGRASGQQQIENLTPSAVIAPS